MGLHKRLGYLSPIRIWPKDIVINILDYLNDEYDYERTIDILEKLELMNNTFSLWKDKVNLNYFK